MSCSCGRIARLNFLRQVQTTKSAGHLRRKEIWYHKFTQGILRAPVVVHVTAASHGFAMFYVMKWRSADLLEYITQMTTVQSLLHDATPQTKLLFMLCLAFSNDLEGCLADQQIWYQDNYSKRLARNRCPCLVPNRA